MKILFHSQIMLVDAAIFVTFDAAVSLMLLFCYLRSKKTVLSFPLKWPFIVYGISCIIYSIYPSISIGQIQTIFSELVFTYIFYQVLTSKKDLSYTIKYFVIIGYLLMVNGLIDWGTNFNPIEEIMKANAGDRYWVSTNNVARFGFSRTTSFMPHSISFGVVCAMLIYLMIFIVLNELKLASTNITYLLILLLLIGVILSNSRTPLITLAAGAVAFVGLKLFKGSRGGIILILLISFYFVFGDYIQYLVDSVLHEEKINAQGSSTQLRSRQLEAALYYYYKNPVFGAGDKFNILKFEDESDVMGMESVWFGVMYRRGSVGIAAHLFLYLGLFWLFRQSKYYKYLFFFIVMWLCACTFSTLPGLDLGFFLCILIVIYKSSLLKPSYRTSPLTKNNVVKSEEGIHTL